MTNRSRKPASGSAASSAFGVRVAVSHRRYGRELHRYRPTRCLDTRLLRYGFAFSQICSATVLGA